MKLADGVLLVDSLCAGHDHADSFCPRGVSDVVVSVSFTPVASQWSRGPRRTYQFGETQCCPCDPNFTKEILKNTKENVNFSVFKFNILKFLLR